MNHPLETFTFCGYTVEIHPDHDAENPRTWCSSTLCTRHRRRTFGGEMLPNAPATIEEAFAEHLADRGLTERDVIWLPVYSFEHSGLALGCTPFSDRWDSGQVGYIYMSHADIRREYGVKRITRPTKVAVYHRLEAEIATLGDWVNGETYYFAIPALDDLSIGSFYGSDHEASGLLAAARSEIRHAIQQKRRAHYMRLKRLIRAGVPLQYRPQFAI